jgi:hypothetical protein
MGYRTAQAAPSRVPSRFQNDVRAINAYFATKKLVVQSTAVSEIAGQPDDLARLDRHGPERGLAGLG